MVRNRTPQPVPLPFSDPERAGAGPHPRPLPEGEGVDPLEVELAEAIVVAVEGASGLTVSVGIADGKFAAYVAALLGAEAGARDENGRVEEQTGGRTDGDHVRD